MGRRVFGRGVQGDLASAYDPTVEGRAAARRVGPALLSTLYLLAAVIGLVIAIVNLPR
ncbi:hypothetical protein GCM10009745_54920 [Kribbella yunnanensis]|uniref:Uncharacterized protein n=1 Tax=Kribbella yunnanensis TaxID=190194 RepID=A0ABP4UC17_9ACTN